MWTMTGAVGQPEMSERKTPTRSIVEAEPQQH